MKRSLLLLLLACAAMAQAIIPTPSHSATGEEGYCLLRQDGEWSVQARGEAGRFYAEQTRRALEAEASLPATLLIEDSPRYGWRGLHLDVSRHWFPIDEVQRFIDCMASLNFLRDWQKLQQRLPCAPFPPNKRQRL